MAESNETWNEPAVPSGLVTRGDERALANWLGSQLLAIHLSGPPLSGISTLGRSVADVVTTPTQSRSEVEFGPETITFVDGRYIDDALVYRVKRTVDERLGKSGIVLANPRESSDVKTHRLAGRTLRFETFGLRMADRSANPFHDPVSGLFDAEPGMCSPGPGETNMVRSSRLPGAQTGDTGPFFDDYMELICDRARSLCGATIGVEAAMEVMRRVASGPLEHSDLSDAKAMVLNALFETRIVRFFKTLDPAAPLGRWHEYPVVVDPGLAHHLHAATSGGEIRRKWLNITAVLVDLFSHTCVGDAHGQVTLAKPFANDSGPDLYVEQGHQHLAITVELDPAVALADLPVPDVADLDGLRTIVLNNSPEVAEIGETTLAVPVSVLWEPLHKQRPE